MNDFINTLTNYYKKGTEGIKIIYFCVIASFIYWIINFILFKFFNLSLASFFLLSAHDFIPYIWTLFTFPFIHTHLLELVLVMLMLYFTEQIFRTYFDGKSFIKFFFLGNTVGGIIFLITSFITGNTFTFLSGAVLGIYSILFAIISYNPKMEVSLFPLPLRFPIYILGLILIGLDIFSLINQNQVFNLIMSRVGAAAFGYFYMKTFQTGNDFLGKWVPDFSTFDKFFSFFNSKPRLKVKKEKEKEQSDYSSFKPKTDEEFADKKIEKQKQIDTILDKISKSGYESLTKEEKDFLFNSSK